MTLSDVTLTSLNVTAQSPAWTKVHNSMDDFSIVVPRKYLYRVKAKFGDGKFYPDQLYDIFSPVLPMDGYAHSLPSPPRAARICTHTDLIAETAPCNEGTLLPYSLSLVISYPNNDGFGTVVANRPDISPEPNYDIDLSNSPDFSTIVKQLRNRNLDVEDIYVVTLVDIPKEYRGIVMYARVRAQNRAGLSEFGNVTNTVILAGLAEPPVLSASGLVSGFSFDNLIVSYIRITVDIPADTGTNSNTLIPVDEYEVEGSLDSTFSVHRKGSEEYPELKDFESSKAYTLRNLTVGITYFIRARARTYLGVSNYSNVVSKILVVAPGTPSNVRVNYHAPLSFNLSWSPPANFGAGDGIPYPVTYQHFMSTSTTEPTGSSVYTTVFGSGTAVHIVISGLTKGTTYFFAVRALNDAKSSGILPDGAGEWSATSSLYAIDVPSAPDNISVTVYSHRAIKMKWPLPKDTGAGNQNHPLVRYELDYSKVGVSNETLILSGTVQEQVKSGLTTELVVKGRVRAVNEVGTSPWTERGEATVLNRPSPVLQPVVDLSSVFGNRIIVNMSFSRPADTGLGDQRRALLGFQVETVAISPTGCTSPGVVIVSPDTKRVPFYSQILVRGCTYSFRVLATNEAGSSNYTTAVLRLIMGPSEPVRDFTAVANTALNVFLSWTIPGDTGTDFADPSVVDYYHVQVSTGAEFLVVLRDYQTKLNDFDVPHLTEGTPVFVRIAVSNSFGYSNWTIIGPVVPRVPPLLNTSISFLNSSILTGSRGLSADIVFTTSTALGPDERIRIDLPDYDLSEVTIVRVSVEDTNSMSTNLEGSLTASGLFGTLDLVRTGATNFIPKDSTIQIRLKEIACPHFEVDTIAGIFTMSAGANFTIDRALNISGPHIFPGSLTSSSFSSSDDRTGAQVNRTVSFILSSRNAFPFDGIFTMFLSSRILLQSTSVYAYDALVVDGTVSAEIHQHSIRVQRGGNGSDIPANTTVVLILSGMPNPPTIGSIGVFGFSISDKLGRLIDQDLNISAKAIVAGNLSAANFTAASLKSFALTAYTMRFRFGHVGLPANATLVFTFPYGVNIEAAVGPTAVESMDGLLNLTIANQDARVYRIEGTVLQPNSYVMLKLGDIRNYYQGPSASYSIQTFAADGGLMEPLLT